MPSSSELLLVHLVQTRTVGRLDAAATEDDDERLPKLATHRTEQNEVDGAVHQSENVEQVVNDDLRTRTVWTLLPVTGVTGRYVSGCFTE